MKNKYIITSGYWNGPHWDGKTLNPDIVGFTKNFFNIWWDNTFKYSNPEEVLIINQNSPFLPDEKKGKWIDTLFNLGHVHSLDTNNYPNKKFAGCSLTFMIAALYCYNSNCDMIYKEQDCLAFGDWVNSLYADLEENNAKMLIGREEDADGQSSAQSIFLIKHDFLLDFVRSYLSLNYNDAGPGYVRPEWKFTILKNHLYPDSIKFMSMGYDRARPASYEEETYYIQQLKQQEIDILSRIGKI
jgi:hypothetical protein